MNDSPATARTSWITLIGQAIRGHEMDYTTGSIRRAVIMLAIPMMLEMIMESVFALGIFLGRAGPNDSSHGRLSRSRHHISDAVGESVDSRFLGTAGAAEDEACNFNAMPNHATTAVVAGWSERMNRTFETIENM